MRKGIRGRYFLVDEQRILFREGIVKEPGRNLVLLYCEGIVVFLDGFRHRGFGWTGAEVIGLMLTVGRAFGA